MKTLALVLQEPQSSCYSLNSDPDALVVIDVCHNQNAVKEAKKLNIPVVAIVDTNGDPEPIDYPIAANDDAVKSIKVIFDTFNEAIKDALEIYEKSAAEKKANEEAAKAEKGDDEKPAKKPARKPAARRPRKTADGELAEKMGEEAPAKKAPRKRAVKKAEATEEKAAE